MSGCVSLGGFPGLPSHSRTCTHTCTHPPTLCAFCSSQACPRLGTPACPRWTEDAGSDEDFCIGDGLWEASPRVPSGIRCQGCLHPAWHRGPVAEPPLGIHSLLHQGLHRLCAARGMQNPARPDLVHQGLLLPLLWLMKATLFSQHCSFTRAVCCIKSHCFPTWWERAAEDVWSMGFGCPPGM